jgi:hypothetical protein
LTGEQIIDAVIRTDAVRAEGSGLLVWSANAPEQIEAALREVQTKAILERYR